MSTQEERAKTKPACTCTWDSEWIDGAMTTHYFIAEPDQYCPEDFPINYEIRENMAANGYGAKMRRYLVAYPWMISAVNSWDTLPDFGKNVWRTWAAAEMWGNGSDMWGDGNVAEPIPTEVQEHQRPPEPKPGGWDF